MTNYPTSIDTDVELPRIDDNLSEMGSETINAMREAIVAIQKTIGEKPQGSTANLVTRISSALEDDGTLKASALIAAGLIALPITNTQVGASAAIEEAKLDLDFATQFLQDQISSNDVDIANLQQSISNVINEFEQHYNGTGFKHDSFMILLDITSPSSTPAAFVGLSAINVGDALIEMNNRYITHAAIGTGGAHKATNVSVNDVFTSFTGVSDVQETLEALDGARANELISHRDYLHANGFDNWANDIAGYNDNEVLLATQQGVLISGIENKIKFVGVDLAAAQVEQGHIVVVSDTDAIGTYVIDDVGPRAVVGNKPLLAFDELEITSTFTDGYAVTDGHVQATIYGESSMPTFKSNVASTFHQSITTLDGVQCSRPNSAKALSLGITPRMLDGTETLVIEVGIGTGTTRSITLAALDEDRNGTLGAGVSITIETIVDKINSALHGTDAFPATAYKVGDELLIAHNWEGSDNYTLKIKSASTGNTILGFDGYGANIVDNLILPTQTSKFYVNGTLHKDFKRIYNGTVSIASSTITFSNFNPIGGGVKEGHVIHISGHTTNDDNGTYTIVSLTSNSVNVHTAITSIPTATASIFYDVVPMVEFANTGDAQIIGVFLDSDGRLAYNQRMDYDKTFVNLNIIDISDNYTEGTISLVSTSVTGGYNLTLGTDGFAVFIPTGFAGQKTIYGSTNVSSITADITGTLTPGTAEINVYPHINEEEVLEVCSVRSNGLITLFNILDKRLYGTTGLDELREDVVQAYIESPLAELRGNGVVRGFDVINAAFTAVEFQSNVSVLIRGGEAYIYGVRSSVVTQSVVIPNTAATYYICLNQIGNYVLVNIIDFTLKDILAGHAGQYAVICKAVHDGASTVTTTDARFFINALDNKVEFILDSSNHMIGSFNTVSAAFEHMNNYPQSEKFVVNVVSRDNLINVNVPSTSRDVTFILDGYIGNLTIDADCKFISRGLSHRDTSHIQGLVNISNTVSHVEFKDLMINGNIAIDSVLGSNSDGQVKFDNVVFNGDLNVSSTSTARDIRFNGCEWASTSNGIIDTGSNAVRLHIAGSTFRGGIIDSVKAATGAMVNVDDTIFLGIKSGSIGTFTGGTTNITDSLFSNTTGSLAIDNGSLSNCTIESFVISSGAVIDVGSLNFYQEVDIVNCEFRGITLSSTASVIKQDSAMMGRCNVTECSFKNITYSVNEPFVKVTSFIGNSNVNAGGAGNAVIQASYTLNNRDFHAVDGTNFLFPPISISGNAFFTRTIGACIDLGLTVNDGYSIDISNNLILVGTSQDGIVMGDDSATIPSNITIQGNHFGKITSAIPNSAINFNRTGENADRNVKVIGNTMVDLKAFRNAAACQDLVIHDNLLDNANFTLTNGNRLSFVGNKCVNTGGTNIVFSGIATDIDFSNNNIPTDDVTFAQLTNCTVSNNIFNPIFTGNLTTCTVSGNRGIPEVSGAPLFTSCTFTTNVWDNGVNFIAPVWLKSTIADNIYLGIGNTQFTLYDISDCQVIISGNVFRGAVTLSAASSITKVSFTNNSNSDTNDSSIKIKKVINESIITGNIGYAINVDLGASGCLFSSNIAASLSSSFSGTISNSEFSLNNCAGISVSNGTTNFTISRNTMFGDIRLFPFGATISVSHIGMNIIGNNVITGSIKIGDSASTISAGVTVSVTNSTIKDNIVATNIEICRFSSVNATAILTLSSNIVSGNKCIAIFLLDAAMTLLTANVTVTKNKIIGNVLTGSFTMSVATDTTTIISETLIESNFFNTFLSDGLLYNDFKVKGCTLASTFTFNYTNVSTTANVWEDISVCNNTFKADITFTYNVTLSTAAVALDGFSFCDNECGSKDFLFTSPDANIRALSLTNLKVNGNNLRSITLNNTSTSCPDLSWSDLEITGNTFFNLVGTNPTLPGIYLEGKNDTSKLLGVSNLLISGNSGVSHTGSFISFFGNGCGILALTSSVIDSNNKFKVEIKSSLNSLIADGVIISNNTDISIFCEITTSNTISLNDSLISGNLIHFFDTSGTTSGTMFLGGIISNNIFQEINALDLTNALLILIVISGNFFSSASNISIGKAGGNNRASVSGNVFSGGSTSVNFLGIFKGTVSGNIFPLCSSTTPIINMTEGFFGTFSNNRTTILSTTTIGIRFQGDFAGTFSDNHIDGNVIFEGAQWEGTCSNNFIEGDLNIIPSTGLKGHISNNLVKIGATGTGNIELGNSAFATVPNGYDQVKVSFNSCEADLKTTSAYNDDTKSFFWGNTSKTNTSATLTINGTTAINPATANKLAGTITP